MNFQHTKIELCFIQPHQKRATYFPKLYIFNSQKSGNASLESKDYFKNISVLLNKHFSCKFHSDTIISKISKTVGLIAKLRHFIPRCIVLKEIYFWKKNMVLCLMWLINVSFLQLLGRGRSFHPGHYICVFMTWKRGTRPLCTLQQES